MRTVSQVSKMSGVSVRTLHYYDKIGILRPTEVTESGYRLYNEEDLRRLERILMLRELDFTLSEINSILNNTEDFSILLNEHIKVLEMKRNRLCKLIEKAEQMMKGEKGVDFSPFDKNEMKKYEAEAKEKWGKTKAYREFEDKMENKTEAEQEKNTDGLYEIFKKFGRIKAMPTDSNEAQILVDELQAYITNHYYNCTDEFLMELGQMYVSDERFRENIDSKVCEGTAQFVCDCIAERNVMK